MLEEMTGLEVEVAGDLGLGSAVETWSGSRLQRTALCSIALVLVAAAVVAVSSESFGWTGGDIDHVLSTAEVTEEQHKTADPTNFLQMR